MQVMLGTQKKVETAQALNFSSIPSNVTEAHHTSLFYDDSVQKYQETGQSFLEVDSAYRFSRESFNLGQGRATVNGQKHGIPNTNALYDIALPDIFLNDYYSQVIYASYESDFIGI